MPVSIKPNDTNLFGTNINTTMTLASKSNRISKKTKNGLSLGKNLLWLGKNLQAHVFLEVTLDYQAPSYDAGLLVSAPKLNGKELRHDSLKLGVVPEVHTQTTMRAGGAEISSTDKSVYYAQELLRIELPGLWVTEKLHAMHDIDMSISISGATRLSVRVSADDFADVFVSRTRFPWTQNWLNRSVQGGPEHDR